jgi:hypothetical protein
MTIINKVKHALGIMYLRLGIKTIKDIIYDIPKTPIAVLPVLSGIKLYGTELDYQYTTTDWEHWNEILDKVYSILGENPWTAEVADCDNRAEFTSALISIMYHLNTCGKVYCEVSYLDGKKGDYLHYANIIVDKDKNVYLFDIDNWGARQKITSNIVIAGNVRYTLKSYRIG